VNKNRISLILFAAFLGFTMQGCLSVETKEYSFRVKKDNSGSGVIKYINIFSDKKDSVSTPENDYRELIDSYLNGEKIADELPGIKNVKKKLYEEDNQLCGEITFDYDDITKLRFYKYKETGPWCYYLGFTPMGLMGGTETYFSSNGAYGGEGMPVIFWDGDVKELKFKTTLTQPSANTTSLLDQWKQQGGK
jgi:hypothetical protein